MFQDSIQNIESLTMSVKLWERRDKTNKYEQTCIYGLYMKPLFTQRVESTVVYIIYLF